MKITSRRDLIIWLIVLSITPVASMGFIKWVGVDPEIAVPVAAAITAVVMFGWTAFIKHRQ